MRPEPGSLDEWLAAKKCDTSLVIDGIITHALSGLTTDESAVFTDYEVDVKKTIYIREGHKERTPLVILKPGGAMKLPEGLVATDVKGSSDLHIGREYILFFQAPKSPADAYYLNEIRFPGVLAVDQSSVFLTQKERNAMLVSWLQQASIENIIDSPVWALDTTRQCVSREVKPR